MHLLAPVISYLALHTTMVFIADEQWSAYLDKLQFTQGAVFWIGGTSDLSITEILNIYANINTKRTQFVILCRIECVTDILQKVNAHEHFHQEQGILTFLHRWFLLVEKRSDLDRIEDQVTNITHLSAMTLYQTMKRGLIYSAMWKPEGRLFQQCAYVERGRIRGELYPNVHYGLNGRRLRVTNLPWAPFMISQSGVNDSVTYSGICFELLEVLAFQMNFTYDIVTPSDGLWGSLENGTWNGLVKQMDDNTADFIFAALTIQHLRATVMDFSYPFHFESLCILYKANSGATDLRRYFLVIMPFKWPVWICIILLVPFLGIINNKISIYKHQLYARGEKSQGKGDFAARVWEVFGITCSQGMMNRKQKHLPHLVLVSWVLTSVILAATYTGNLVAMLAVDVENKPFRNLEELIKQDVYKYGVMGGTANVNFIKHSDGILREMWIRLQTWEKEGIPVLSTDQDEHIDMVNKGLYAYLGDFTGVKQIYNKNPNDLRIVTINNFPPMYGIGLQKNSVYKDMVSDIILRQSQNGLFAKWEEMYNPDKTSSESSSGSSSSPAISVSNLLGLFAILALMLLLAAGILLAETAFH